MTTTATVVKWGNARGIRLPNPFLETLDINENDTVNVITENNAIIIRKAANHQRKSLKQRLEEFHGTDIETILKQADASSESPIMIDWGEPVGEEIW